MIATVLEIKCRIFWYVYLMNRILIKVCVWIINKETIKSLSHP